MIWHMFPGLDLYYADPARQLITEGEELDDLQYTGQIDHHMFEV